ncbi:MAG: HEAT repeat domain-containing protein, partial [Planctomycetota bacterium]|nr:HEAT repeat domain-containing protein [Planctomycetota bacterium]
MGCRFMRFVRSRVILLTVAVLAPLSVASCPSQAGQTGAGGAAGDAERLRDVGERVRKVLTRLNRGVTHTESAALQRDLLAIGPEAVPVLADAIRNPRHHLQVRWNIALVLGKLGDVRAADALLEVVRPHPVEEKAEPRWIYLRAYAALALGRLKAGQASKVLLGILSDRQESSLVRRCAALALGRIADARALDVLARIGFDRSEDRLVRAAAFLGLAISGGDVAMDRAAEFLFGRRLRDDPAAGGAPGANGAGAGAAGQEAAGVAGPPAGGAVPVDGAAAGERRAGGPGDVRVEGWAIAGEGRPAAGDDAARPTCIEGGGVVAELRDFPPDGAPAGAPPRPDGRPSGGGIGADGASDPAYPSSRPARARPVQEATDKAGSGPRRMLPAGEDEVAGGAEMGGGKPAAGAGEKDAAGRGGEGPKEAAPAEGGKT